MVVESLGFGEVQFCDVKQNFSDISSAIRLAIYLTIFFWFFNCVSLATLRAGN